MYEPKIKIQLKELSLPAQRIRYVDDNGDALSLVGYVVSAELKDARGKLVDRMKINVIDADAGIFFVIPSVKLLPHKTLYGDIRIEKDGVGVSSDIIEYSFKRVVTGGSEGY